MKEITSRLELFEFIEIKIFDESVILNQPVENWPLCSCFLSFFSKGKHVVKIMTLGLGFPLEKAIEYEQLRKPFVINDLVAQWDIQDRVKVYQTLKDHGIETPRYVICDRSDPDNLPLFDEADDYVEINGEIFYKPFVEKPLSAENHRINIYYPTFAGDFQFSQTS